MGVSTPERPLPEEGLIVSYVLDGLGGGTRIGWDGIRQWTPDGGFLWVHLDYSSPESRQWILEQSGLDEVLGEALLVDEARPRSLPTREGLLVALRGVNLNPGANPEDMVSIRMWLERHRVISVRKRRLLSVDDLRAAIERGEGPCTPADFLADLSERLVTRMADVVNTLDETVDDLDQELLTGETQELRGRLAAVRREAIMLRRYLAPQRDAMGRLHSERVIWLDDMNRMRLREQADRLTRYVEDLDARMYVLSIFAFRPWDPADVYAQQAGQKTKW